MKIDVLQNQTQTKDTKISTLENSIAAVKEMCAAKIKVCINSVYFIRVFPTIGLLLCQLKPCFKTILTILVFQNIDILFTPVGD